MMLPPNYSVITPTTAPPAANGYYLGIDASGYPVFYLDTDGATAGCEPNLYRHYHQSQRRELALPHRRGDSGTSAVIYLDGLQIGSDTSVTSYASITVTSNIQIASNANYDGGYRCYKFYSRALTLAEINPITTMAMWVADQNWDNNHTQ